MNDDICSKCGSEIGWGESCYYCKTVKLKAENKDLKDSNDELLKLLNQLEYFDDDDSDEWIRLPIRKAEALKEKEHQEE